MALTTWPYKWGALKALTRLKEDDGILNRDGDADDESIERDEEADESFVQYLRAETKRYKQIKIPTRRIPPFFAAFHTGCMFVKDYCQEACFNVVRDVCRKYKCSRNVSLELVRGCNNCNVTYITRFPRKLLTELDFMKRYQKVAFVNKGKFPKTFEAPKNETKKKRKRRPKLRHREESDHKGKRKRKNPKKKKALGPDEEYYFYDFPSDDLLKSLNTRIPHQRITKKPVTQTTTTTNKLTPPTVTTTTPKSSTFKDLTRDNPKVPENEEGIVESNPLPQDLIVEYYGG